MGPNVGPRVNPVRLYDGLFPIASAPSRCVKRVEMRETPTRGIYPEKCEIRPVKRRCACAHEQGALRDALVLRRGLFLYSWCLRRGCGLLNGATCESSFVRTGSAQVVQEESVHGPVQSKRQTRRARVCGRHLRSTHPLTTGCRPVHTRPHTYLHPRPAPPAVAALG